MATLKELTWLSKDIGVSHYYWLTKTAAHSTGDYGVEQDAK